jgi:hypothetical protein
VPSAFAYETVTFSGLALPSATVSDIVCEPAFPSGCETSATESTGFGTPWIVSQSPLIVSSASARAMSFPGLQVRVSVPGPPTSRSLPGPPTQVIVSCQAVQLVVAALADEVIGLRCAAKRVVSGGADAVDGAGGRGDQAGHGQEAHGDDCHTSYVRPLQHVYRSFACAECLMGRVRLSLAALKKRSTPI